MESVTGFDCFFVPFTPILISFVDLCESVVLELITKCIWVKLVFHLHCVWGMGGWSGKDVYERVAST